MGGGEYEPLKNVAEIGRKNHNMADADQVISGDGRLREFNMPSPVFLASFAKFGRRMHFDICHIEQFL